MGQEVSGSDGAAVGVEEFGIISEDSLIVAATGKLCHGIVKGQVDNLNRETIFKAGKTGQVHKLPWEGQ